MNIVESLRSVAHVCKVTSTSQKVIEIETETETELETVQITLDIHIIHRKGFLHCPELTPSPALPRAGWAVPSSHACPMPPTPLSPQHSCRAAPVPVPGPDETPLQRQGQGQDYLLLSSPVAPSISMD